MAKMVSRSSKTRGFCPISLNHLGWKARDEGARRQVAWQKATSATEVWQSKGFEKFPRMGKKNPAMEKKNG